MVYVQQKMVPLVLSMVSMSSMCMAASNEQFYSDNFAFQEEDKFSLLQLRSALTSTANVATNSSRLFDAPGSRERQQCPHEIEAELAAGGGDHRFGCQGTLRAQSTRECSFWGEPHMSSSWVSQLNPSGGNRMDVLYKPGLFRMAAAKDGSWEIQIFNCGRYVSAMAARFGKDVIEVVSQGPGSIGYFLNGEIMQGGFPLQLGKLFIDGTHRKVRNNDNNHGTSMRAGSRGACIDDPGSQIYIDLSQQTGRSAASGQMQKGNLNILLEAATDSYTTNATDGYSLCNVELLPRQKRYLDWPIDLVKPEDSLFISSGNRACAQCSVNLGWGSNPALNSAPEAQATCASMQQIDFDKFDLQRMCRENGIALANAEGACVHLQNAGGDFYSDCQFDFCAEQGSPDAVANAEEEEHAENPQPICAIADDACDPAAACCSALKEQAILNFGSVTQNNLCGRHGAGARELRYGSVLTQKGQVMDLVVTPQDDYDCVRAVNTKNGNKGDQIGVIAIQAGMEVSFNFQFVSSGTDNPITPTSLMFSFLDIDQGKKNKQRESVEVCGAVNAFVTDNSELEQSSDGDCIKFTSTTHGTGQDNPDDPESMSGTQRARTVAYQVAASSFTATLGVSKKANKPRKFIFAGNPSVACVLQA